MKSQSDIAIESCFIIAREKGIHTSDFQQGLIIGQINALYLFREKTTEELDAIKEELKQILGVA
jgi:hypothetical protein